MPSAELGPGEIEVSLLSPLSHGHRSPHLCVVRALAGEAADTALAESGKLRQKDFLKKPTREPPGPLGRGDVRAKRKAAKA